MSWAAYTHIGLVQGIFNCCVHSFHAFRRATTHTDLVLRAHQLNIPYQVIHNASIMNAVGCCGLQVEMTLSTKYTKIFCSNKASDNLLDYKKTMKGFKELLFSQSSILSFLGKYVMEVVLNSAIWEMINFDSFWTIGKEPTSKWLAILLCLISQPLI